MRLLKRRKRRAPFPVRIALRDPDFVIWIVPAEKDGRASFALNQTHIHEHASVKLESRTLVETYLKAATFVAPAIAAWALSGLFVFPKLKTLWRDAGFED